MPNVKISELASAAALDGSEELPIVQNGTTVKATAQDVANLSSLLFTPENVANKSQSILADAPSTAKYPSVSAVKTYVDDTTAGLLDDRGSFSPSATSPGAFPSTGGSGGGGAILKGDIWFLANDGFLGTTAVLAGGSVRALVNSPASASDWDILDTNIVPLQNLQQVLNQGISLVDGNNGQGDNALVGNSGINVNAFGAYAGYLNQGNYCNLLGTSAGQSGTGNNLNAMGQSAGVANTGFSVNAFGLNAAGSNNGDYVNAFGANSGAFNTQDYVNIFNAGIPSANNQNVYGVTPQGGGGGSYTAREDFNLLTNDRTYQFPDKSGTVAMLSDITGGGGSVVATTISLSSAQLQSLTSIPLELLPAPGAGKAIDLISMSGSYTFNTIQYFITGSVYVAYSDGVSYYSTGAVLTSFLNSNYSFYRRVNISYPTSTIANNSPIYLLNNGGVVAGGDGTFKLNIVYTIIDL